MIRDILEMLFASVALMLGTLLILALIILGIQMIDPILDSTTCRIAQGETVIYDGPGYRVYCKSAGDSTSCTIGKPAPFQNILEKRLIDTNLKMVCE